MLSDPSPRATADMPAAAIGERDAARPVPLAVDLDGTLIATDLLVESLFVLAKKKPAMLARAPFWLLRGLAHFKQRLAREVMPDFETLPYNRDFLAYLRDQKRLGRSLILATGADQSIAQAVATQLGCFDAVLASDGRVNLRGKAKRDRLVAEFGLHGFDYAGNAGADQSVWRAARRAILVHPDRRILRNAEKEGLAIERVFDRDGRPLDIYARALRLNHWVKNVLVFVPLVASHPPFAVGALSETLLAFLAFSLCASSLYLINDMFDLAEDRRHPRKSQRVLASGQLALADALLLIPLLWLGAAMVASRLPLSFVAVLAAYFALMLAYNLKLRDLAYLDVATLGGGYALRVVAGAAAASLALSPWLLAFCFLLFVGLAVLKRYADLMTIRAAKGDGARVHAYSAGDGGRLAILGCGGNGAALLLLAYHYATDDNLQGRHILILAMLPLILIWLAHMWLMAWRGRIVDDPVAFALADRISAVIAMLSVITLLVAA